MMRLSAEVFAAAEQRQNPLGERELVLRGLSIPAIEHMQITRDAFDAIDFTDNRIGRLENFPRMLRLTNLLISGNVVESVDAVNLSQNLPNLVSLVLSHNRVSSLNEVSNIGKGCPKLEFLCLRDNPVTRRQHYRMFVINHIPSLRVLDLVRISETERSRAERLARSAAGAALEKDVSLDARQAASKTFVPGEGRSLDEAFATNFTHEQRTMLLGMIASAKSPAEIEQIELSVQRGVLPSLPAPTVTPPNVTEVDEEDSACESEGDASRKRPQPNQASDRDGVDEAPAPRKRMRTRSSSRS